jgi:hypothetical protein
MLMEFGGGGRTRTYDLRIMRSELPAVNKEDKGLQSAEPGKVLQNPQPPRNQEQATQLTELGEQQEGTPPTGVGSFPAPLPDQKGKR